MFPSITKGVYLLVAEENPSSPPTDPFTPAGYLGHFVQVSPWPISLHAQGGVLFQPPDRRHTIKQRGLPLAWSDLISTHGINLHLS